MHFDRCSYLERRLEEISDVSGLHISELQRLEFSVLFDSRVSHGQSLPALCWMRGAFKKCIGFMYGTHKALKRTARNKALERQRYTRH
jgi:hypothetical protein